MSIVLDKRSHCAFEDRKSLITSAKYYGKITVIQNFVCNLLTVNEQTRVADTRISLSGDTLSSESPVDASSGE